MLDKENCFLGMAARSAIPAFTAMNLKDRAFCLCTTGQHGNMLFENSSNNTDLINFLAGKQPLPANKAWVGLILLALALADWQTRSAFTACCRVGWKRPQNRTGCGYGSSWIGESPSTGVELGVPPLVNTLEGGAPDWIEPFKLNARCCHMDSGGYALNIIRSVIHAGMLLLKSGLKANREAFQ
jgi:hypothetical protein